jgi:hypothetical protein
LTTKPSVPRALARATQACGHLRPMARALAIRRALAVYVGGPAAAAVDCCVAAALRCSLTQSQLRSGARSALHSTVLAHWTIIPDDISQRFAFAATSVPTGTGDGCVCVVLLFSYHGGGG